MGVGRAEKTLSGDSFELKLVRVGLQETNNYFLGLTYVISLFEGCRNGVGVGRGAGGGVVAYLACGPRLVCIVELTFTRNHLRSDCLRPIHT